MPPVLFFTQMEEHTVLSDELCLFYEMNYRIYFIIVYIQ